MKSDFHDDPEGYWQEKKEREEADGKERLERWEKQNPNLPYGYYVPKEEKWKPKTIQTGRVRSAARSTGAAGKAFQHGIMGSAMSAVRTKMWLNPEILVILKSGLNEIW